MDEKFPSPNGEEPLEETLRRGAADVHPRSSFASGLRARLDEQMARGGGSRRWWQRPWRSGAWAQGGARLAAAGLLVGLMVLALLLAPQLLGPRPAAPAPGQPVPGPGSRTGTPALTPEPTATMSAITVPTDQDAGEAGNSVSPDGQWSAVVRYSPVDEKNPRGEQTTTITVRGPARELLTYEMTRDVEQARSGLSELKWWPNAPEALYFYENTSQIDQCHRSWSTNLRRMDLRSGEVTVVEPLGETFMGTMTFVPDSGEVAYIDRTQPWESSMPKTPAVVLRDLVTGGERRVEFQPIDKNSWGVRMMMAQPDENGVVLIQHRPANPMCDGGEIREEIVAANPATGEALQQPMPVGYQFEGYDVEGYARLTSEQGGRARMSLRDGTIEGLVLSAQEQAGSALFRFLSALAQGDYDEAAGLYGGSLDDLRAAVGTPFSESADAAVLFRAACESGGLACLPVKQVAFEQERDGFHFQAAYSLANGDEFIVGDTSRFRFHVRRVGDGEGSLSQWRVVNLPPRGETALTAEPTADRGTDLQPPPEPTPSPREAGDQARVDALLAIAGVTEEIPAPAGGLTARIRRIPCTLLDTAVSEESAYEIITLHGPDGEVMVDDQLINCGGLGGWGLASRGWSADGRYFYYTNAREGTPDGGCWAWYPPLLRYDTQTGERHALGGGAASPDGNWYAALPQDPYALQGSGALTLWDLQGGTGRLLPAPAPGQNPGAMAWSPDSAALTALYHTPDNCPPVDASLALLSRAEGTWQVVLVSQDPVFTGVAWSPDGKTLSLHGLNGASRQFEYIDGRLVAP